MPVLSVVNTKGGTGKTTTAIFLATALAGKGKKVRVLDLDRQGSATDWAYTVEDNGDQLPFVVESATIPSLRKDRLSTSPYDYTIIDAPPGDSDVISAAIEAADFVVIPTTPTSVDTWRTLPTVNASDHRGQGVLITKARVGTKSLRDLKELFDNENVPVFATEIPLREEIAASGGAIPQHLFGYDKIADEIEEVLG